VRGSVSDMTARTEARPGATHTADHAQGASHAEFVGQAYPCGHCLIECYKWTSPNGSAMRNLIGCQQRVLYFAQWQLASKAIPIGKMK
jgi:hypothetical protein